VAGEAFNFSAGKPVSVLALVRMILGLMGRRDLKPRVLGEASHEILRQHLDAGKARQRLGWKPTLSLAQGLRRTIAWYADDLARPGRP